MSVDKLVDSTQLDADLTSVANAIRTKGGTSASLAFPADFVSAIAAIPTGGGGLSGVDGGIYTPASETSTFSVPVNATYSHIVFISTSPFSSMIHATGSRTVAMAYGDSNQDQFVAGFRSSDGGDKDFVTPANDWRGQISFGSSTISGSFYGNGAKVNFPAGQSFQWFAW